MRTIKPFISIEVAILLSLSLSACLGGLCSPCSFGDSTCKRRRPLAAAIDPSTFSRNKYSSYQTTKTMEATLNSLQDIIGTDAGNRGMKSLIVPGDLIKASTILAVGIPPRSNVLVLSGFPCCVNETPPTETDGPPGAFAIARAACALGHTVTVVTDACNEEVFAAAMNDLGSWATESTLSLQIFPGEQLMTAADEERLTNLSNSCDAIIACERAGPAKDGHCYTMRGIDMTEREMIAPLHRLIEMASSKHFIAIGDGGNEMGMGKVIQQIISNPKISNGNEIGCVVAADHLIAASVSNWGGYALAAGAALVRAEKEYLRDTTQKLLSDHAKEWVEKCVPSEEEEVALLQRCVEKGCRDGVSGKVEATVDGMPLETSLKCLRDIRQAVQGVE